MMPETSSSPTRSPDAATPDQVWALIDARGADDSIGPRTRLAGLSLLARHGRVAARAGFDGIVVWVDDDDRRDRARAALDAEPPPPALVVEFAVGAAVPEAPDRRYVPLEGRAVYAAADLAGAGAAGSVPEPLQRIADRADLRKARRVLYRSIRKSIDQDGVVSYFAFRPISQLMSRALIDTPVSPNQVSLAAMAFGIAAAVCAGFGTYTMVATAGALYWIGAVVDCVDGELARLRMAGSKLGEWLDTLADDVSTYGLMAGLGVGLHRFGADPWWLYVSVGGAAIGFLLQVKLYADLHRWNMTIDTAQYPWFFGTPSEGSSARRGVAGTAVYLVGFAFRRDAFVTIIAVALAFGAARAAVVGLCVGLAVFAIIFVAHAVVMTVRPSDDAFGPAMKWSIGYFGIKDLFTVINLLGGVGGIYFALEGNLEWAGYSIFAGYIFGDALDGPVARLTRTSNKFGSEFDAAADHVAQAIAPAIIVYVAFTTGGHQYLGLGLMALLFATASIRQARFNVADFNYPLTYCGLPRTISGLVAISLPNSTLFFENGVITFEVAAGILALVAILNLCPVPYMTHKGKRHMQIYVKLLVLTFLAAPLVLFVFAREFVYDALFVYTFGYALTGWIPLSPDERREFWTEYRRWAREVDTRR